MNMLAVRQYFIVLSASILALVPSMGFADFCEIMAGESAPSCRINAKNSGATITGNWLKIKPEQGFKASTGKKAIFSSATSPAYTILGVRTKDKFRMTIDCFAGERSMRIQALPYMLGLANGRNDAFNLTFYVDNKPAFKERWPLDWQRAELQAPQGSRLLNELQGSQEVKITTDGILGNKSTVGYIYKLEGYDSVNTSLCL